MAITFINAATAASAAAASITVNKPTNTAQGDLMVAHIFVEDNTDRVNSVPTGWTNIINATVGTRAIRQYVYWKIAGASEPSSYQWGINATDEIIGQIATFRGTDQTSPIGNYSTSTSTASGQPTAPGINIQTAYNWAVFLAGNAYGTTYTPPSGYDERADTQTGTGSANISATVATKEYTAAGATGDIAATAVNTDYYVASLVELKQYIEITSISVSDSGAGVDAIVGVGATLALSDSGAGSDSFVSLSAELTLQDTAMGSDSIAEMLASPTASDSGAGSESIAISGLWQGTVDDAGTGSDAIVGIGTTLALSDSGAGVDGLAALSASLGLTDSGAGADVLASLNAALGLADGGAGTDTLAALSTSLGLADSGAGAEVVIVPSSDPYQYVIAGYGEFNEEAARQWYIAGYGLIIDPVSAGGVTYVSVSDGGAGADLLASLRAALGLSDSGAGVEAIAELAAVIGILQDIGMGTEAINAAITGYQKEIIDGGTGYDEVGGKVSAGLEDAGYSVDEVLPVKASVQATESGVGIDAASIKSFALVSDSAEAVESVSTLIGVVYKLISDSGSGIDSLVALKAVLLLLDVGAGTDLARVAASLLQTDGGVGLDGPPILKAQVYQLDAGIGYDTIPEVRVAVHAVDSATGADVMAALRAAVMLFETGSGFDAVENRVQLSIDELGIGLEYVQVQEAAIGVPIEDGGVGSDSTTIKAAVAVQEMGQGVEATPIIRAGLLVTEFANGLEVVRIEAQLHIEDSAVFEDWANRRDVIILQDGGIGVDEAQSKILVGLIHEILRFLTKRGDLYIRAESAVPESVVTKSYRTSYVHRTSSIRPKESSS